MTHKRKAYVAGRWRRVEYRPEHGDYLVWINDRFAGIISRSSWVYRLSVGLGRISFRVL